MPVRTIPKNYRNLTGLVPNTRTSGMTAFESTLERDFLLLLDFDLMWSCSKNNRSRSSTMTPSGDVGPTRRTSPSATAPITTGMAYQASAV
jgi:hypothetical protein